MLVDVLPTEARDEVTALRFTCMHCHEGNRRPGRRQANRRTDRNTDGQRGGRTNGSSTKAKLRGLDGRTRRRRGRRTQTKETGGPADDRRTGAQIETRTDREVDGQTEAQGTDHVS